MKYKLITLAFLILSISVLSTIFAIEYSKDKIYIVKNNDTRDYNFEHYCDSIYEVDKDYYYDVLMESDSFQLYIDKHGEWWTNQYK